MTAAEILKQLKSLGSESYCSIMKKHGAVGTIYGVKVEDLKKIQKKVKKDQQLAIELYDSGVHDAMYLAGLIADEQKVTKTQLRKWLKNATSPSLQEYTVSWLAAESKHGHDLALEWIDSKKEPVAAAGWSTMSSLVGITDDADLDLKELKQLLKRVEKNIHQAPHRVKYWMNNFVIAVGSYVAPLNEAAKQTAGRIGKIEVDLVGGCKLPDAIPYIEKVEKRGTVGKKRKMARC